MQQLGVLLEERERPFDAWPQVGEVDVHGIDSDALTDEFEAQRVRRRAVSGFFGEGRSRPRR